MSSEITIKADNLSKCYHVYNNPKDRLKQILYGKHKQFYREFWALHDISFEVKKGQAFGIIGRNGAGKSTLLQLICKTLTPTTGTIETNGKVAALLELGSGFNPEFTGRENVYMNGSILGFTRKEIDKRFDEIASFADIGDFIDQPVKVYSSGMYVRLAFAVQVCVEPDILVVDEALSVGDIFFRQKCYKRLNSLLDKGVSVILVSHGMNEVEQFCQQALLLSSGKKHFLGKSNEAVRHYYLLQNASHDLQEIKQEDPSRKSENHVNGNIMELEKNDFFWPNKADFLDISNISQVGNNQVKCTAVAICDSGKYARHSFQQGETISFFYEFELLDDIEDIFTVGINILNDKGLIVHGKGTLEYGTSVPKSARKKNKLRVRQDISLNLAIGEYTFEIGLGSLNKQNYEQRRLYSYEELYSRNQSLCHVLNVGCFAILPRNNAEPVQLTHHGVANLPGSCQVNLI